ncbi:hypothetical protein TURU_101855 [Turdus rufiventris]|nr:hypothetical protein TURU_101855 [Turdus rufiventris]
MDKVQKFADTRKCALYSSAPYTREITVIVSTTTWIQALNKQETFLDNMSGLRSIHSPPSLYLWLGIALTQVQDLALGLVELHEVHTGPPLKPVQVPLNAIPSLLCVNRATQLGVIGELAEDTLGPTVHVTNKDVEQPQVPVLTPEEHHLLLLSYLNTEVLTATLSMTIQQIPYLPSGPSIKSLCLQFRDKDTVRDNVNCFARVQVDDIGLLSSTKASVATSSDCHNFSNMMDSGLATSSTSSLRTHGFISSGPMDLCSFRFLKWSHVGYW